MKAWIKARTLAFIAFVAALSGFLGNVGGIRTFVLKEIGYGDPKLTISDVRRSVFYMGDKNTNRAADENLFGTKIAFRLGKEDDVSIGDCRVTGTMGGEDFDWGNRVSIGRHQTSAEIATYVPVVFKDKTHYYEFQVVCSGAVSNTVSVQLY